MGKEMNYNSLDSLKNVARIIDEAGKNLKDKTITSVPDELKEIIGALVGSGVGVGAGIGIIGVSAAAGTSGAAVMTSGLATAGGIIGGGMMAGVFVVTAPVAILGIGGYAIASKINRERIQKQKEILLKEAVAKHNKIIKELNNKADKSKERIDHLVYLNTALRRIIDDLESDIKKTS